MSRGACPPELQARLDVVRLKNENKVCFDCPMKNPVWTSVPFGVFLCLDCSGRHRSYGTHISFVRSANMDVWTEEQIRLFEAGGNSQARGFFKQHGHTGYLTVDQYSGPTGQKYKTHLKALSEGKKPSGGGGGGGGGKGGFSGFGKFDSPPQGPTGAPKGGPAPMALGGKAQPSFSQFGGEAANPNAVSAAAIDWGAAPAKPAESAAASTPPAADAASSVNWGASAPAATVAAPAAAAPAAAKPAAVFAVAPVQRATFGAPASVPSAFGGGGGSSTAAAAAPALFQTGRKAPVKKKAGGFGAFGGTAIGGAQKASGGTSAFDAAEKAAAEEEAARKEAARKAAEAAKAPSATQMAYQNSLNTAGGKPGGAQAGNGAFRDNRTGDNFFSSSNNSGGGNGGGGGGAGAVAPAFGGAGKKGSHLSFGGSSAAGAVSASSGGAAVNDGEAQARYGNAKAIGSDMYNKKDGDDMDPEVKARLASMSASGAISSAALYGDQDDSAGGHEEIDRDEFDFDEMKNMLTSTGANAQNLFAAMVKN